MILVTGATGKVGGEAARLLAEQGRDVRVLVRDAARAEGLRAAGAEVATGDFDDPASLAAVTDGVEAIVLVSPAVPAQELAVIEAARANGVGFIVKITSKASADSPIARRRGQTEIEAGLTASGIPHTLLRNNAYFQNLLVLAPAVRAQGGFGISAGDGRTGMIDTRDVGAVAAAVAADPGPHVGRTYWPTGPDLVGYQDVADTLTELLGRPITFTPTTPEQDKRRMIAAGVPAPIAHQNAQAFALTAEGDAAWRTDDVQEVLGRPPRDLRTFLTDHLTAFA